jgi:[acyl-carrier-protein] S-malonyltransferase
VRTPAIRYVSAVDACEHSDPQDIRAVLVRQISSPVRWPQTLRAVCAGAIAQVIECGPGRVLTGLNRRIEKRADLSCLALEDPASIGAALRATQGDAHA